MNTEQNTWFLPPHLVLLHNFLQLIKPQNLASTFPLSQVKNLGNNFDYFFFPHYINFINECFQLYPKAYSESIHSLHHVLPGIPVGFLLQHFIPPLKNCSNQSHVLKTYIRYNHSLLKVCRWLHYVLEIHSDFLSSLQSPKDLDCIFFPTLPIAVFSSTMFFMPLTSYLFNCETSFFDIIIFALTDACS